MPRLIRTTITTALAFSPLFLAAQRPSRPTEKSARQFVNTAYGYEIVDPTYDITKVFTPSLKQLLDADNQLGPRKVHKLNVDPLCDCQNKDDLQATIASISVQDRRADVSVAVVLHDKQRRNVRLTLLWTSNVGWRIDNISTPEIADVREALR